MVEVTKEYRTLMYTVRGDEGHEGEVVVHKLPFNAREAIGMQKLQKYVARGFSFEDPRKGRGIGIPEVVVSGEVRLDKPVQVALDGVGSPPELVIERVEEVNKEVPVEVSKEAGLAKCPECDKSFPSFLGLEAHMRKHRREKGELKPYKGKKRNAKVS